MLDQNDVDIRHLAPDGNEFAAAQVFAHPGAWHWHGTEEGWWWGRSVGLIQEEFYVLANLAERQFSCTCPVSTAWPCRHVLGLLLLSRKAPHTGQEADCCCHFDVRQFVSHKVVTTEDLATSKTKASREASRIRAMTAGMEHLDRWLQDVVRLGVQHVGAAGSGGPNASNMATELENAKMPLLAADLRELGSLLQDKDLLGEATRAIGRLATIVALWQRREQLTPDAFAEVRIAVGWPYRADDLADAPALTGTWTSLGTVLAKPHKIYEQRTWLWHHDTDKIYQVLDFHPSRSRLPRTLPLGKAFQASMLVYPGVATRRVAFAEPPELVGNQNVTTPPATTTLPSGTLADVTAHVATSLAAAPLTTEFPVILGPATITADALIDSDSRCVSFSNESNIMPALSLTGGHPAHLFGIYTGSTLHPVTVFSDTEAVACV